MEDSWLEAAYEDRFESYNDYDPNGYDAHDDDGDYWADDEPDDDDDRDVDDDFPMYLEYDGPFGLSGYDEY